MEFIYDRSAQDVLERTKKGVLNATDLNRIESNTRAIANKIAVPVSVKSWSVGGLPRVSDFQRILANTSRVRAGYAVMSDTPQVPTGPLNYYEKWNAIEKILNDVNRIYEQTENAKQYCGEIIAGEGIGVI